jgi:large subunit ribosomal protein L30e
MAIDITKEIRRAVDTGKVVFGTKGSEKSLKKGNAKLLIIAGNIPKLAKEKLVLFAETANTPVLPFSGTAIELGNVCGKPFTINAMVIEDQGNSKVLDSIKK